jgi:hypothetical protein
MRFMIRSLVLTSAALLATSAFAADKAVVNVPFNFESHGQAFPAGSYTIALDQNENVVKLCSVSNTSQSATWTVSPADRDGAAPGRMTFDVAGSDHELRTIQLGPRVTSILDAPAKHHGAGSSVAAVSGQ